MLLQAAIWTGPRPSSFFHAPCECSLELYSSALENMAMKFSYEKFLLVWVMSFVKMRSYLKGD